MKRLGITGKLVLSSVCILVCLGALVTWYSVRQFRNLLYRETIRRVEAQTLNWIEANTPQIALYRDRGTLDRLVGELQQRESIAYVLLADEQGRILAAAGAPAKLAETGPAEAVAGVRSRLAKTRSQAGVHYFEASTPISASGTGMSTEMEALFGAAARVGNFGSVRVAIEERELDRRAGTLVADTVTIYAVLVLLALLVSGLLAKRMVTPISALARVANQIASGNLHLQVREGRQLRDEVGELVRNFNQMAQRLAENRDEMNRLHAGLEEKVRERTAELQRANERLQELDQLKSHFLSMVSHELRTPLTSIKAFTEILVDTPDSDTATRAHFLEIINQETDRLTRLITDLLDLARIESGAVVWRIERGDLRQTATAAAAGLASLASEKGLNLEVATAEPQPVRADPDRMHQVLTNLMANAIRFCPPQGRILVRLDRTSSSGPRQGSPGPYVRVAVEDSGPGVPPEERQRVFDRFYQLASHQAGGAGLGLAICREIVLHHGGEIWVESEMGRGSTFCFTIPLAEGSE